MASFMPDEAVDIKVLRRHDHIEAPARLDEISLFLLSLGGIDKGTPGDIRYKCVNINMSLSAVRFHAQKPANNTGFRT